MIVPRGAMRIVVATRPVDFRKGHDGLAAVVEHELGFDPHSGVVVVFRRHARRPSGDSAVGRDGSGARLQAPRAGALCVAGGARRGDAAVTGAVRGVVRGAGLEANMEPSGAPPRGVRSEAMPLTGPTP